MPRTLRALLTVLLVLPLTVGIAGAGERDLPWAVANSTRRQALLHRSWPDDGVPGSILVTTTTQAVADAVASDEGGLRLGDRVVLLHVEPGTEAAVAGRVAAVSGVLGVEPDRLRQPAEVPNDTEYADQWSHRLVNTDDAWDTTTGSSTIEVAILDTGVVGSHPDLRGNLIEQVDLSSGRALGRTVGSDNDSCNVGHGTFVAGVVGAIGDNARGVAGVAWDVSMVDVALTSPASRCGILDSAIVAGIAHVINPDRGGGAVDIINLSLGAVAEACPMALQTQLDAARASGTLVVAAAGNDQLRVGGAASIPASCDGVMSVAAVGDDGEVARYSNVNEWVDVAAPGGNRTTGDGIVSTTAGGGYGEEEGTSFASPYVAGVAALLRSVNPDLTPDDLESLLEHTASHRGASRDDEVGWGLIDTARAVAAADAGDDFGAPEADPDFPVTTGSMDVVRVKGPSSITDAVPQAVAVSERTFEDRQAIHAVLARSDDYADALAGSSLGFGVGPLLFSKSTGPLSRTTANELQRVLPSGSTVYILGGTAALPSTIEGEIRALGFEPVRLAGTTRELTAIAVATELERFLEENEFSPPAVAIVATARNWPDAVSAGALGAWFGMPVLVTPPTALDTSVRDFLAAREWDGLYVVGGTAALSEDVRRAARDAAGLPSGGAVRLAGVDRSGTMVAVSAEFERIYADQFEAAFGQPAVPNLVAAVNLRRADGYAHVLSASALIGALAGVFVPVEGDAGDQIEAEAQAYVCRFPAEGVVAGGMDVVADATVELFDDLLKGDAPACRS